MIRPGPYEDHAAMAVFRALDLDDLREAELARGAPASHLALFAEWRQAQAVAALSRVVRTRTGDPFAVLAVVPLSCGVAQAAFLSRSHARYRRPLAEAAIEIRTRLPAWAAETGLSRIEARCWTGHPTAGRFLRACGFGFEVQTPGYGADGGAVFEQYAWIGKGQ